MASGRYPFKLVGVALLIATGVSVTVTLVGQSLGLSDTAAERMAAMLFFPVFLGVCTARRDSVSTS